MGGVKIRACACTVIEAEDGERVRNGRFVTMSSQKQLLKLSEESLMKEPEEVFDLEEKIGEGLVPHNAKQTDRVCCVYSAR